jgi:uncharacterized protein YndB with AHSA1/START domain
MSCAIEETEMSEHVVRRSVLIPAEPADVWDALVDPSRLEEWFADEVDAEEIVTAAEVVFRWDDGSRRVGVVEEVDAPRRLAFRWSEAGGPETAVVFELADEDAGTRVTVVETGLSERTAAGRVVRGWSGGPVGSGAWGPRMAALGRAACLVLA